MRNTKRCQDSLSAASQEHRAGSFSGIPNEVPLVERLEKDWYAVRFYTDEELGRTLCAELLGNTYPVTTLADS